MSRGSGGGNQKTRRCVAGSRFGSWCVAGSRLSLRELEAAAGAALAVLLTLLHPAVAGEKAGVAEGRLEAGVELGQGAAQAHDDRAGLAGRAAAVGVDQDVHLAAGVRHLQRAEDRLSVALVGEVFVERAAVDFDL